MYEILDAADNLDQRYRYAVYLHPADWVEQLKAVGPYACSCPTSRQLVPMIADIEVRIDRGVRRGTFTLARQGAR